MTLQSGSANPRGSAPSVRYDLLIAALAVAAILATNPVLEMGVNDDWSYIWTARALAKTGAFAYSGWSEPMIGIQAVWAAWLFKIFGFSFTIARLSTLPFAAGTAVLLNRLGRAAGLNTRFAFFGALSLALSPLFIPLSASFMTDVPSCFFWLACVYWSIRAATASHARNTCLWLAAAALAGLAGGTVRQVVWVVPLTTLPLVAWVKRRQPASVAAAAFLWCSTAAVAALCARWFNAQPNAHVLTDAAVPGWPGILSYLISSAVYLAVGGLVFLIPAISAYVVRIRELRLSRTDFWVAAALCASTMFLHWWFRQDLLIGNTVTISGAFNGVDEALGARPAIVNSFVRGLLKTVLLVSGGALALALSSAARQANWRSIFDSARRWFQNPLLLFAAMLAPGCLVYLAALLYRAILFDRYLLPVLPLIAIPLLWLYQSRGHQTPPRAAWIVLVLFASYGVAVTHDYFAASRARERALSNLLAAGVQRLKISAGLESDAWAELLTAGRIRAAIIEGEQRGEVEPFDSFRRYPVWPPYWFWAKAPHIDPVYLVTYSRMPGLEDSGFSPVPYRIWLPPSEQRVFTQTAGKQGPALRPGWEMWSRGRPARAPAGVSALR